MAMLLPYNEDFFNNYKVYQRPQQYALSNKKISRLKSIANYRQYYLMNPVKWIEDMYNIELLDYQKLMVETIWFTPNVLIVASRALGKSTIIDLSIMGKQSLIPNWSVYIASGTASQSAQTFTTLEKLANDQIDSFQGSSGEIFKQELVVPSATGDGFNHNPGSYSYKLYNGANTHTLTGNVDASRGIRCNEVVFDESGFLLEELINVYGAFTAVDTGLITGKDESGNSIDVTRQRSLPSALQNQRIYISSASSVETRFYKLYKDFAIRMIEGDPDYAILHLDCQNGLHPTLNGEEVSPLLTQKNIDIEMRTNPEKAKREYFCIFSSQATNAIIKRGVITRNEENYLPVYKNPDGKHKYVLCIDPSRNFDNSTILVGDVYDYVNESRQVEKKVRIVNCIVLKDVTAKRRKMLQIQDQVDYIRNLIVDLDGGTELYDNIIKIYIDLGAGGQATSMLDLLASAWIDKRGVKRHGLIDKVEYADYVRKFPKAVDKICGLEPVKYKSIIYTSFIEMANQDVIKFTSSYDGRPYLMLFEENQKALEEERKKIEEKLKKKGYSDAVFEEKLKEEMQKVQTMNAKTVKLDNDQMLALRQIDALKEEIVNIVRHKSQNGKDQFSLSPDKVNTMHDDRAYTCALLGYAIYEIRRNEYMEATKKADPSELINEFQIRRGRGIRKYI